MTLPPLLTQLVQVKHKSHLPVELEQATFALSEPLPPVSARPTQPSPRYNRGVASIPLSRMNPKTFGQRGGVDPTLNLDSAAMATTLEDSVRRRLHHVRGWNFV
mmetsp:Transcript_48612/g.114120  ORF Transcript_48612/g.114120 Transcript_48612/m.114120 type:complete len:104 (+) Transcript_48612:818-1129(+)